MLSRVFSTRDFRRLHAPSAAHYVNPLDRNFSLILAPLACLLAFLFFPLPASVTQPATSPNLAEPPAINAAELTHEWPLEWTERVLVRLEQTNKKETDPWFRDDYRIAWITVKWAAEGVPEWSWRRDSPPHVAATYQVLHCHPDEVWPRMLENRRAKLGAEYSDWYDAAGNLRADAPKKDSASAGQRKTEVA